MYAGIGPAINYDNVNGLKITRYSSNAAGSGLRAGLLPLNGGTHPTRKLTQYGNAAWVGLPGQITVLDPFRIAWDAVYGSVQYDDPSMRIKATAKARAAVYSGAICFESWARLGKTGRRRCAVRA